jgi:hypothetical protein
MPHFDGPAYRGKVVVLSVGGYAVINFQKSYNSGEGARKYEGRILLEPNSIHIFEDDAYVEYLHGIENYVCDSVLLRYDSEMRRVVGATVGNYELLGCR